MNPEMTKKMSTPPFGAGRPKILQDHLQVDEDDDQRCDETQPLDASYDLQVLKGPARVTRR